jgi:predicted amidophosphoribosyltransferase
MKMKGFRNYAEPLGKALAILLTDVSPDLAEIDVMVPVPLHPDKIAKRGFNQAEEVAHIASRITGQPVLPALRKTQDASMNVVPSREGRKQAVRGLYEFLAGDFDIGGKSILLIDDVITTGFNVSECSSILVKSGARKVCVAALARNALS